MKSSHIALANLSVILLSTGCQRTEPPVEVRPPEVVQKVLPFKEVRMMSGGPQVPFPSGACGSADKVIKVIVPKNFPDSGFHHKVKWKGYNSSTNTTVGGPGTGTDVNAPSSPYDPPKTKVDFETRGLFDRSDYVAVKIIVRHPKLYFDPKNPITLTLRSDGTSSSDFCGLKVLDRESDEDDTANPTRKHAVARFFIRKPLSPSSEPDGYNIHLMMMEGTEPGVWDVPITIDPKVENNG